MQAASLIRTASREASREGSRAPSPRPTGAPSRAESRRASRAPSRERSRSPRPLQDAFSYHNSWVGEQRHAANNLSHGDRVAQLAIQPEEGSAAPPMLRRNITSASEAAINNLRIPNLNNTPT